MMNRRPRILPVLVAWGLMAGAAGAQATVPATNRVSAVMLSNETDATVVRISGTTAPTFTQFTMNRPPRVVLDLSGAMLEGSAEMPSGGFGAVAAVEATSFASDHASVVRVVIELTEERTYDIRADGSDLLVRVGGLTGGALVARAEARREALAAAEANAAAAMEAERIASLEPERTAREAAEIAAREAAEVAAREEAARVAREEAAREAAEIAAREEAARLAREEAARIAREEAAREAAEIAAREAAEIAAREEAARLAREEAARIAREEAAREAAEIAAREAAEIAAREAAEIAAREAAEIAAREAAEIAAREEAARLAREESARVAAAASRPAPTAVDATAPVHAGTRYAQLEDPESVARGGAAPQRSAAVSARPKLLSLVGFRPAGDDGVARVVVQTNEAVRYRVRDGSPNVVILELENTRARTRNDLHGLDTTFFQTAVERVDVEEIEGAQRSIRIVVHLKERVPYEVKQDDSEIRIEFRLRA
jgi:colicin import membrane protein